MPPRAEGRGRREEGGGQVGERRACLGPCEGGAILQCRSAPSSDWRLPPASRRPLRRQGACASERPCKGRTAGAGTTRALTVKTGPGRPGEARALLTLPAVTRDRESGMHGPRSVRVGCRDRGVALPSSVYESAPVDLAPSSLRFKVACRGPGQIRTSGPAGPGHDHRTCAGRGRCSLRAAGAPAAIMMAALRARACRRAEQ